MKFLLQRVAAFQYHVIDAPETSVETRETAETLSELITDAINGNYREDKPAEDEPTE